MGAFMKLSQILQDIRIKYYQPSLDNIDIKDIKISHKDVKDGDLFIAIKGGNFDGNDFINEAFENGASVVFSENDVFDDRVVRVENARSAYAIACKNFFGRACDKLKIVGITGTNGKTTTAFTTAELLRYAGARVGLIGTLGAKIDDKVIDTGLTTPDPYMLHKLFKEMKDKDCEYVVMEVSAHALALNKVDGVNFDMGVLTNITEDHLDFFGNMENYANAKINLFDKNRVKLGVICGDDHYGRGVLLRPKVPVISYGMSDFCDVNAKNIKKSFSGSSFDCECLGEKFDIKTNLVGEYNIQNALASIAVCRSFGVPKELIRLGMSCINQVEGRFNVINMGKSNIVIDYAHTPDGLEKILKTARDLSDNKLVVIFGCGGNRDRQKRSIMGTIATKLADEVILTSDNPRYENPYDIISDIVDGVVKNCKVIENRKEAIRFALDKYKDGQTIVIAGKGAEKYQEINGKKYPYNDFDVVYEYFREKLYLKENAPLKNADIEEEKENDSKQEENIEDFSERE